MFPKTMLVELTFDLTGQWTAKEYDEVGTLRRTPYEGIGPSPEEAVKNMFDHVRSVAFNEYIYRNL